MFKKIPIFWKLSIAVFTIILLVQGAEFILDRVEAMQSWGILRIIIAVITSIVLGLGTAWIFVNSFIKRPVQKLTYSMSKLANKEFEFRLEVDEKDEFGTLASSFNEMASMLASYQSRLKRNKDYLEGILESTADIIITVSPDGNILTVNTGMEKALGYQRDEVIGQPIEMLFVDPREREIAISKLQYADSVTNYETRFRTKDGKVRNVLLTLSRLTTRAGVLISTIGISKDITEEKRLQKQLVQSQRYAAIGQVFTGVQHSMKNMLNACKGGSYMVRLGLSKDDKALYTEGWEIVQGGIKSLTDMSMDMLKYVREWKPKLEQVDIAKILSEVSRNIGQTAKDNGIAYRLNENPDLQPIICDYSMIHSAVMDIVSNALDACEMKEYNDDETPEVVLTAYLNGDRQRLVIEAKDNGCGMTDEIKASIFNPFFSTKNKAGTGIGLSTTFRMIEAHNGEFEVESQLDIGTSFRIILPIEQNR